MLEHRDHVQQIQELKKQVKQLYDMVKRANKKFWWTMLEPEPLSIVLEANPLMFEMGDVGELQTKLQECYNAWVETPGAIGVIWHLVKGEGRKRENAEAN
jgi:hypothetical protein